MITACAVADLVRETYAAHYVLWNVGIEPAEIKVIVALRILPDDPRPSIGVAVCVQRGGLTFTMPVGPELASEAEREAFKTAWMLHVDGLDERRRTDRAGLDREARSTTVWNRKVEILYGLLLKGFQLGWVVN